VRKAVVAGAFLLAAAGAVAARAQVVPQGGALVRILLIAYRAHDGSTRKAWVELPAWYGPTRNPPIPLVISPHGRGVPARKNVNFWGNLPALGGFAVVNPEGEGRRLPLYSWGDRGQIADLARMPEIVRRALPWLHIERNRVYAVGGSMGGQEVLLLLAHYPHLLAGAVAFDAPTNLITRYEDFRFLRGGRRLQALARYEIGGAPARDRGAYMLRSPADFARAIAFSGVPLQLWWSTRDRIVRDGWAQSGALYRAIQRLNPGAPVAEVVGRWRHCAEMRAGNRMPDALRRLGLLDDRRRPHVDFD
jgi:poly(3-hydroxybutyrate) depolymerase